MVDSYPQRFDYEHDLPVASFSSAYRTVSITAPRTVLHLSTLSQNPPLMTATAAMPNFVKASANLGPVLKRAAYVELRAATQATLAGETDRVVKQATLASLIKTFIPYAYWAGFYDLKNGELKVGPYQGTLGCLSIPLGRGVCGRVAQSEETIIERDVHALPIGTAHIACDPNSRSEIVVPCFSESGDLFAVLDVDSSVESSFDEIDRVELEALVREVFG